MIGSGRTGAGFGGVLRYLLHGRSETPRHEPDAQIIGGNMMGDTASELTSEFGYSRRLNERVQKPVWHVSLSLPEDEYFSTSQWNRAADKYMQGMGFSANQWVMIRHADTNKDHVHIVASRVRIDNKKCVDMWQSKTRSQALIRQIEKEMGVKNVPSTSGLQRRPTREEQKMLRRTKAESPKTKLQKLITRAVRQSTGLADFCTKLRGQGIGVKLNIARTGHISGISYDRDGVVFKGSKLGKAFSWKGLQRQGLTVQGPDDLSAAREVIAGRQPGLVKETQNRKPAKETAASSFKRFCNNMSVGPSVLGRIDHTNYGRDDDEEEDADEEYISPDEQDIAYALRKLAQNIQVSKARRKKKMEASQRAKPRPAWQPEEWPEVKQPKKRRQPERDERTKRFEADQKAIIARQLAALNFPEYDIRVIGDGPPERYTWTPNEALERVPYLARKNASGAHIYVAPTRPHGVLLVDDLKKAGVAALARDNDLVLVNETSPGNYQAWVSDPGVAGRPDASRRFAEDLAAIYDGDKNAARWSQPGRLAGFTNRKPKHLTREGKFPYVRLVKPEHWQKWQPEKRRMEPWEEQLFTPIEPSKPQPEKQRTKGLDQMSTRVDPNPVVTNMQAFQRSFQDSEPDPAGVYLANVTRLRKRHSGSWGANPDWSRLDFMVASDMLKNHRPEFVEQAIREGAPQLGRNNHEWRDYARRTVKAALEKRRNRDGISFW